MTRHKGGIKSCIPSVRMSVSLSIYQSPPSLSMSEERVVGRTQKVKSGCTGFA